MIYIPKCPSCSTVKSQISNLAFKSSFLLNAAFSMAIVALISRVHLASFVFTVSKSSAMWKCSLYVLQAIRVRNDCKQTHWTQAILSALKYRLFFNDLEASTLHYKCRNMAVSRNCTILVMSCTQTHRYLSVQLALRPAQTPLLIHTDNTVATASKWELITVVLLLLYIVNNSSDYARRTLWDSP